MALIETKAASSPESYTVAWLCALPSVEFLAAQMMLDHYHEKPRKPLNPSDKNAYFYGDLNGHNVVLASLPINESGKLAAQELVVPLNRSFPNLKICLFVGIGGGVPRQPRPSDSMKDIHLGDVVVGLGAEPGIPGIIQYDYARRMPKDQYQLLGSVDNTTRELKQGLTPIINKLDRKLRTGIDEHLVRLQGLEKFDYPGRAEDILFNADYEHVGEPSTNCRQCSTPQRIQRPLRNSDDIAFHVGTILSGDTLMMDAHDRDMLSGLHHKAILFEMEAAGVMPYIHGLIIRGVSDYADSHKDPRWRDYAAGAAAAFAREYLLNMQPDVIEDLPGNILDDVPSESLTSIPPQSNGGSFSHRPQGPLAIQQHPTQRQQSHGINAQITYPQSSHQDDAICTWLQGNTATTSEQAQDLFNLFYGAADQIYKNRYADETKLSQSLSQVQGLLRSARLLLQSTDQFDPKDHPKLYVRQLQVERYKTFEYLEPAEIDAHLHQAELFGREALEACKQIDRPHAEPQVKLEMAFTQARKVKVEESRSGSDDPEIKRNKKAAQQTIKAALHKLQSVDVDKYKTNKDHADWWIKELSG